jgi:hypothetical protein
MASSTRYGSVVGTNLGRPMDVSESTEPTACGSSWPWYPPTCSPGISLARRTEPHNKGNLRIPMDSPQSRIVGIVVQEVPVIANRS